MSVAYVSHEHVKMARAWRVTISSADDLMAHVDCEILCTGAHCLELEVLRVRLHVRC
jgi:hypothetical protein